MSPLRRLVFMSCVGLALCLLPTTRASAQLSNDPYSPWNSMYRPFVFPNTYFNPALPNQARLNRMAEEELAPRFGNYFDSLSGFDQDLFGRSTQIGGRGVPYHQAFRAQRAAASLGSIDADRTAVVNRGDTFLADQQSRQRRFFEAMRERNPRKRAELLREIEAERLQATRSASAPLGRDLPAIGRPRPAEIPGAPVSEPAADASTREPAARPAVDPFTLLRPLAPATSTTPRAPGYGLGDDDLPRVTIPRPRPVVPAELENLLNRPASSVPDPIIPPR